jgi:hypothetical protein
MKRKRKALEKHLHPKAVVTSDPDTTSTKMQSGAGSQRHPPRPRLTLMRSIVAAYNRKQSEVAALLVTVIKASRMEHDDGNGAAQEAPASLHLSLRDQTNGPAAPMMATLFKSLSRLISYRLTNPEARA